MADKLMYIKNDDTHSYLSCRLNYWLKRLDTQLNTQTNQNTINVPKVVIIKLWELV